MDLAALLRVVQPFFAASRFSYALCGGVALGSYGFAGATFDLDLVTVAEAQESLVGFLNTSAFQLLHRSPGFSNHLHPELGRLDVVYVRGRTAERLFANTRQLTGPAGLRVPVVAPEHLLAMKLAACRQDPSRVRGELASLAFLVAVPGADEKEMEQAFQRYGFKELWDALRPR